MLAPDDRPLDDEPSFLRSWNSHALEHAGQFKLPQRVAYRRSGDLTARLERVRIKSFGRHTASLRLVQQLRENDTLAAYPQSGLTQRSLNVSTVRGLFLATSEADRL